MSKMGANPPHPGSEKANYPMKMIFPSRFCLDFSLSPIFAVAYSVFP
jgi:hypothetical protein